MPGMDGFELAELMRGTERTRGVPIIFLTAGAMDQQRRFRGYEAGAVDFIFKPIEPHILQSKAGIFFQLAEQREALKRRAEEAQAANRAKDDFLAALSHELRTPLTPVLMSVSELEQDASLAPEVRAQLSMVRRNVELEARLIDDLLDLTRINRGKLHLNPVPTDLHQTLRETVEIVRSDFTARTPQVLFSLEALRHYALSDPTRIQQVFWNLIKNAFKFTPTTGTITIRTNNDASGRVIVQIEDTGIGISAEALPHIFKAFEQGDQVGKHQFGGLGLGLAISKEIINLHGGEIYVQSEGRDRGATFVVALSSIDAPSSSARDNLAPTSATQSMHLLVVEDHEATKAVLGKLLRKNGHTVTIAASVSEALAAFAVTPVDVLISDLGLPDGTGIELMREVRRQRPIPGIALSGYGMENDLQKTREAGFYAHLVKPINFEKLCGVLKEIEVRYATCE